MASYEADKVIVELLAQTDNFDGKVKQSAATFENSMATIERSGAKAEAKVAQGSSNRANALAKEASLISRFSQSIGADMVDVGSLLTGPRSPFTVIPKQASGVSSALGLVAGAAGGMAGALVSVAVPALMAGAAALFKLATDADSTEAQIDELVEKLKENAEKAGLAEQAAAIFAQTLEGLTEATRNQDNALKKLNDSEKTFAERSLHSAVTILRGLEAKRAEIETNLKLARSRIEAAKAGLGAVDERERFQNEQEFTRANDAIGDLEKDLAGLDKTLAKSRQNFKEFFATVVTERAQSEADPLKAIKEKYDGRNGLINKAKQRAIAEGTVSTELARQIRLLEKQRKLEEDAAREAARKPRADRSGQQSGRQISEAEARQIVAGIGGTVTSGFRTPEHNRRVGGQSTSYHLEGQALDIKKTAGLTLAKIVKAFADKGVRLIEKLDEGDHFHVAWAKRGGGKRGPSAETLAKRAQSAADAAERREQGFQNELAGLNDGIVSARQSLMDSAEAIAQLELTSIEISRAKYEDNVKSLEEQRRYTKEEAKQLIDLNNERAKLRADLVKQREEQRKRQLQEQAFQNASAVQDAGLRNEQDVLQSRLAIAKTTSERHAIERRLL
jgi:hypothetical protein